MIEIVSAQTGEALEHVIALSQEYVTWMTAEIRERYPELDVSEFTAEHEYDDVRQKFPGEHVPPAGCLLVALSENEAAGCVALGRLTNAVGEMRTLYVRPAFRGLGVGRRLAEASLAEARKLGYGYVRLDTLTFMDGALALYRSLGFCAIDPYRDVSTSLKRYIRFFELDLSDSR
ncbi:MAG: GNAT family N-acetyltransferase [Chloroflexi bacterium]|nr:GNAT family N-acetyltransferase [Chloroflexota bacterium]